MQKAAEIIIKLVVMHGKIITQLAPVGGKLKVFKLHQFRRKL